MKNYFLLLLLFFFSAMSGQPTRIKFTYDAAGNQIKREICSNCLARTANDSIKTAATLTGSDMIKDDVYDQISYYPNPVREELYVKWVNIETKYVSSIEVYSLSGQSVQRYTNLKGNELATIGFLNYPSGYYNVVLLYSDGERKTLKIVKK